MKEDLIKFLADRAATYVVSRDETADYEVLAYGYDVLFQSLFIVLIALLIALPFGLFFHVLACRIALALIKSGSGGAHARHRAVCILSSVVTIFAPSFLAVYLNLRMPVPLMLILFGVCLLLVLLYAPADTQQEPIRDALQRKKLKRNAVIGIAICFACAFAMVNLFHSISVSIVITSVIVCCMTHPAAYWLMGCKKSNTAEEEKTA